ncbi:MAG: hypothetical protein GY769_06540 [bacterium]|nr:hypothetical protein [bacterium]
MPQASSRPLGDGPHKYVAPAGSDRAAGTEAEPWRTVAHAIRQLAPGDTLVLRQGVYYGPIEIRLAAVAGRPITIRPHPNELVIIDGGFREFFETPRSAWKPVGDGAEGEYRSTRVYPGLSGAQGLFGDSMVPLHSYTWLSDLRSDETVFTSRTAPLYCGPGLWYNPRTRRIHVRLAHDRADYYPLESRYRGATDPREVPMVVTGSSRLPMRILGSSHLVIEDLVIRGAGRSAVEIIGSESIRLDGVTAYSGYHALVLENTRAVRVINSRFRGPSAPWSSRISLKYKGTAGVLLRTAGVLTKNLDLEVAWNEFTDGHDGVFLGEARNADFHHNLVENFNDDGIFLTSRSGGNGPIRVFRNRISRCLSSIVFGWGRGRRNVPGEGVYVYRNVIEHLTRVYYEEPRGGSGSRAAYGNLVRDHGSPIWEPMKIYQNTFVARRAERWMWTYLLGLGSHLHETTRDVFNNIVVHIEDTPSLDVPAAGVDFRSDGNLFWSATRDEDSETDFFARYRASEAFEDSRAIYPPGWESDSVYGDPAFVRFDAAAAGNDYRLGAGSAAVDAGVRLPAEWPDPLRSVDSGESDIGALPAGSEPLRVGPRR